MRLGQSRAYSVILFVATVIVGQNIFRVCLSRDSFVVSIYFPFESMRIIMSSLLRSRVVVLVLMKWSGVRALSGELLTPDSGGEKLARSLFPGTGGEGVEAMLDLTLSSVTGTIF